MWPDYERRRCRWYSATCIINEDNNGSKESPLRCRFNQLSSTTAWQTRAARQTTLISQYAYVSDCANVRPCVCVSPERDSWGRIRVSSVEMHRAVLWECPWHESQKPQSGRDSLQLHQQVPGTGLRRKLTHVYYEIPWTHLQAICNFIHGHCALYTQSFTLTNTTFQL